MRLAVTGHRPDKLGGYGYHTMKPLGQFARSILKDYLPGGAWSDGTILHVNTGMAQGWDQAIAAACADLGIPFTAVIPFEGQESLWPERAQRDYRHLLKFATNVVCVDDALSRYPQLRDKTTVAAAMQERNHRLLYNAGIYADRLLALWNGSPGGTKNTVRLAELSSIPIHNVWSEWVAFEERRRRFDDAKARVHEAHAETFRKLA